MHLGQMRWCTPVRQQHSVNRTGEVTAEGGGGTRRLCRQHHLNAQWECALDLTQEKHKHHSSREELTSCFLTVTQRYGEAGAMCGKICFSCLFWSDFARVIASSWRKESVSSNSDVVPGASAMRGEICKVVTSCNYSCVVFVILLRFYWTRGFWSATVK